MKDYISSSTLQKPEDWKRWNHAFQLQLDQCDMTEYIREKKPYPTAFKIPDIRESRYAKTAAALRQVQPIPKDTPTSHTALQEKADGQWKLSDLTEGGQKAYMMDLEYIMSENSIHQRQQANRAELINWMLATVSPHYITLCCHPESCLYEWYENLKAHCG